MDPWGLPLVNTLILLSSGVSITWAHKKIVGLKRKSTREESFRKISYGIALTIFIGIVFSAIQLFEYCHALFTIEDGIYASVFFLLTGFHGFHVLIGTVFIIICLFRH